MIPLIYSCGPKAMDTVPETGQGRCPLYFSKLPDKCMSSSLVNTVLEVDLIGTRLGAGVLSSALLAGRFALAVAAFSVAAALVSTSFFFDSLIARSRARLIAAAMAFDNF